MKYIKALAHPVTDAGRHMTAHECELARKYGVRCSQRCWLVSDGADGAFLWRPAYNKGHQRNTKHRRIYHGILLIPTKGDRL